MIATMVLLATMSTCPMHAKHMAAAANGDAKHGAAVDARHDTFGMGHDVTHHSFRLFADGGAIELRANDDADAATAGVIQKHLRQIVAEFEKGEFATPAFVHGREPAGIDGMKANAGAIKYRYESLPSGGRIRITTTDAAALAAVHEFLKFQVIEHRTGDSGAVEEE